MIWRDRLDRGFERWGRLIVRHRWPVLVLALLFLLRMASLLPQMRVENASESYLHGDDPASIRYEAFREQFGQDDHLLVTITPRDVFEPSFLEWLRDLHATLEEELPHVTEVNSLVNARRTRGEGDILVVEELLADWPTTPEAFAELRARVLANPLYVDTLLSRDGRTTTITIEPPGGGWTAIVPICPFTVDGGETTVVGLELNLGRSFRWMGDRFHFQPRFVCEQAEPEEEPAP